MEPIKKLICKAFHEELAHNTNIVQWVKNNQRVISEADVMHAADNTSLDDIFID